MILVTGENKEEIKQRNRKGIISNVMGKKNVTIQPEYMFRFRPSFAPIII